MSKGPVPRPGLVHSVRPYIEPWCWMNMSFDDRWHPMHSSFRHRTVHTECMRCLSYRDWWKRS